MAGTAVLEGARILWVDDDAFIRTVGVTLLKQAGADMAVATSGLEALECLLRERFDCVVMDVHMLVMDGLQATRIIRANPMTSQLPIIAMTGNTLHEERALCIEAGMNDFLSKPVVPSQLYATLARWLAAEAPSGAAG